MTKTTKISAIFFITTLWLVIMRIVFSFVELSDNVSGWLFSIMMQVIGMGVIPFVLFKFWVKEDVVSGFSLKVKIPPVTYLLAIVLGFLLSYVTTGVSLIWQNILILLGYTHVNAPGTIYSDAGVLIMELFTTAMLPAFFEEFTDRGLVLRMFRGIDNEKTVVILTAVLFGLAHQNIMQTGYAFVGGLAFAFLALKTKSIFPGIIIHFINNALSVVSGYSSQHNGLYAAVQDKFYAFISGHFLVAVLTWAAAGTLIVVILKYIAKIQPKEKPSEKEGDVFFFPNKLQYVDDIFGAGLRKDIARISVSKPYWYEYAFLYGSIAMMTLTTLFTFMWGVWR